MLFYMSWILSVLTLKSLQPVFVSFYDFSSAFNTIQHNLLSDKVLKMNVDTHRILWINRLLNESPSVCQTGIMFYIRSCIHRHRWATGYMFVTIFVYPVHCRLPEYSWRMPDWWVCWWYCTDWTGYRQDDRHYLQAITDFVQWYNNNFLELNIGETKGLIIDFRKNRTQPNSVVNKAAEVERVSTYTSIKE